MAAADMAQRDALGLEGPVLLPLLSEWIFASLVVIND
jgi:hypothetical protein